MAEFSGATKPSSIEGNEHLEVNGVGVKRVLTSGFDGSALQDLTTDADGHLQVDVLTGGGGGTQYADGAVRGTATGTLAMGDDGANIQSLKCDSNGVLQIGDNGGALTVDGTVAVTNAALTSIDNKLVSGTDIGDVTINNSTGAAAVNIQDGGNTITVDGTVTANATLAAETTKVIGTINVAASQTIAVTQGTATNLKAQAECYQGGTAVAAGNPLQVSLANHAANSTAVKVNVASGGIASGGIASGAIASGATAP